MTNTMISTITNNTDPATRHDWEIAGEAWGSNAIEWAALFEHYALDVITAMIDQLDLGPDSTVLDIAGGSGLALRLFGGTGAQTAGIDAAGRSPSTRRAPI